MVQKSAFKKLVVVIPTRNRADLAVNAIRSVLSQGMLPLEIVVSDNSTSEDERRKLQDFCDKHTRSGFHHIVPPIPVAMPQHYDWAFSWAMDTFREASHFSLLTDRMIFRPDQLPDLLDLTAQYPDQIITYNHDRVNDFEQPVRLDQAVWTGELWEFRSAALLDSSSKFILHNCLPRVMNTIVPRTVFELLRSRYGNLFDSVAPDFNFCFRTLEMFDSFLYYDKTPLLHYALQRSNGESQTRGIASKDHLDFMAQLKGKSYSFAAPIPEVATVGNAIMHEYCVVREQTGGSKMPEIAREAYLNGLAKEVSQLGNTHLRDQMRIVLAEHGWKEPRASVIGQFLLWMRSPGRVLGQLARWLCPLLPQAFWTWLARQFGVPPPTRFLRFTSTEDALAYDQAHPRPKSSPRPLHPSLAPGALRQESAIRENVRP